MECKSCGDKLPFGWDEEMCNECMDEQRDEEVDLG